MCDAERVSNDVRLLYSGMMACHSDCACVTADTVIVCVTSVCVVAVVRVTAHCCSTVAANTACAMCTLIMMHMQCRYRLPPFCTDGCAVIVVYANENVHVKGKRCQIGYNLQKCVTHMLCDILLHDTRTLQIETIHLFSFNSLQIRTDTVAVTLSHKDRNESSPFVLAALTYCFHYHSATVRSKQ